MQTNLRAYEKPIVRLNVVNMRSIYSTESTQNGVTQEFQYELIDAHASGDAQTKYIIIDMNHLISSLGTQEVSIRQISPDEASQIRNIPETASWYSPNKQIHISQYPVDVEAYFNQCGDWHSKVDRWITEGLDKDKRLVDCVKSIIIPLLGKPTVVQPLNAHSFWITNTGAGKSSFAYLWGSMPITDAGKAGLLGSYFDGKGKANLQHGLLHGNGFPILIDEVDTLEKSVIPDILTYMETGEGHRGLKVPVVTKGTKTLLFAANPANDDLLASIGLFIAKVCTLNHPERIGRRTGYFIFGNDYKDVSGQPDLSLRDEVRRVIDTTCRQFQGNIQHIISDNMEWIKQSEDDVTKQIDHYAETIPHEAVSAFVSGQAIGSVQKLKTSALRYIILEQLHTLPSGTLDLSQREEIFHN